MIRKTTGHKTIQFPRAVPGMTAIVTATAGRKDEDILQLRDSGIYTYANKMDG